MFQFPRFPRIHYLFMYTCRPFVTAGSPIRVPPDQRLLAAPRGISLLAAPFFGS